jgi:hypothetical protein
MRTSVPANWGEADRQAARGGAVPSTRWGLRDSVSFNDLYGRFALGVPPQKNGDFAFLLHILACLKSTGKGAVILPHGVLFRGGAEASIRREVVRRGYIKGIIGLPANLFYGTGIPACIVVLDKEAAAARKGIFLVDASKGFIKDGNKNRLRQETAFIEDAQSARALLCSSASVLFAAFAAQGPLPTGEVLNAPQSSCCPCADDAAQGRSRALVARPRRRRRRGAAHPRARQPRGGRRHLEQPAPPQRPR